MKVIHQATKYSTQALALIGLWLSVAPSYAGYFFFEEARKTDARAHRVTRMALRN